ncbi:efflux RND transporter periplasmic adaptor subunit [Terrarubrum flagellatum]|uniref:efflux RND transporter periplasmic adaptor subunit n=1 Tax=Terrirubrum flagellatum TaxID=2895980 RepID=UPI00314510F7
MESARSQTAPAEADASNIVAWDRSRAEVRDLKIEPKAEAKPEAKPEPAAEAKIAERPAEAPEAKQTPASPSAAKQETPAKKKGGVRKVVLPVILIGALAAGGWYGHEWWTVSRFMVSTDDAYVQADVSTLGVKVSGYVAKVAVKDGDRVKAGDVLVTLDDVDYRVALQSAEAKRATQSATIARIEQQIVAQESQIEGARAGIVSAEAGATRAAAAFVRAQQLAQQNFSSKATLDQATADRDQSNAAVVNARAALASAEANLGVIKAQKVEAEQVAKELDAAIAKARNDLDATVIRAPVDGVVGNRAAQPGMFVAPGSRLLALVPLQSVYIAANFKETQLGEIRPGQKVTLKIDSVKGRAFEGTVESFSPASGSTFSLLPPENATGNFTKITQRVPVRVQVPVDVAALGILRPGLSVVASVDTRTGPKS